jgi:hypothetical protein
MRLDDRERCARYAFGTDARRRGKQCIELPRLRQDRCTRLGRRMATRLGPPSLGPPIDIAVPGVGNASNAFSVTFMDRAASRPLRPSM